MENHMEKRAVSIDIRKAVSRDAADIARTLYQAFHEFRHLYTPDAFQATVVEEDIVLKRMREGKVWLALKNYCVVGTAATVKKQDGMYIRGMAVLPSSRGLNVGKKLLMKIEEDAREKGIKRLYLCTTPFLLAAITLYKQYGFQVVEGVTKDLYGVELIVMEKYLGVSY